LATAGWSGKISAWLAFCTLHTAKWILTDLRCGRRWNYGGLRYLTFKFWRDNEDHVLGPDFIAKGTRVVEVFGSRRETRKCIAGPRAGDPVLRDASRGGSWRRYPCEGQPGRLTLLRSVLCNVLTHWGRL